MEQDTVPTGAASAPLDAAEPENRAEVPSVSAKRGSKRTRRQAIARKAARARWHPDPAAAVRTQSKPAKRPARATLAVFGRALAAAESRLAAAIQERAYHANSLAALDAEIPSLTQTIRALQTTQGPSGASGAMTAAPTAAATLASAMLGSASAARGATLGVDLAEEIDEDRFLRESEIGGNRGGAWH